MPKRVDDLISVPRTMQAVVYRGIDDLRLELLPVPCITPHDLLVKVAACGVCPTDIKKIKCGTVAPPRIFGHETAGTIVRMGALVRGFRVGDRVALHHHVPCMDCHACRHRSFAQCLQYKKTGITAGFEPAGGGYAEYVRVMSFVLPGVVRIPAGRSFEEGAMLEPVNTVLKAVTLLPLIRGDVVLVVGQGPIGLMFTRILQLRGIRVIAADLLPGRLRLARRFGARSTFEGGDLRQINAQMPRKSVVDAAIVTAPSDAAVHQAHELVRPGGAVMLFAHTTRGSTCCIDPSVVCMDEKALVGSYSADFTLQKASAALVFTRKLEVASLITHRFGLDRTAEAIAIATQPSAESLKIMVVTPCGDLPTGGL